jgi:hypothetical protein
VIALQKARTFALAVSLALVVACGQTSNHGDQPPAGGSGGALASGGSGGRALAGGGVAPHAGSVAAGEAGNLAGSGGFASGAGGGDSTRPDPCAAPEQPETPLRRLTHTQFDNTVRQVLGVETHPGDVFPAEEYPPGLGSTNSFLIESYHRFAHDFAFQATSNDESLREVLGCDLAARGESECLQEFLAGRVARLLRRPLDADDESDFSQVFTRGAELGGGFAGGVRAVLEVALQSPEFLYRVELGEPANASAGDPRAGWGRLTPYEMASRLSYFYWDSAPDDELVQAAASGGLRTREEVTEQARRLLGDDQAKLMARPFYSELFGLSRLERPAGSPISAEMSVLLARETDLFLDYAGFGEPGDFETLLTSPSTWVNEDLASHYGVPGVFGDEFVRVELEPSRRAGILTQGSFLVSHAHESTTNPFSRGLRVVEALLCQDVPVEPALPVTVPEPPPPDATTRQRWEIATSQPECAECHRLVNQIGFAFEHYDQWGVWRDTENGLAIDTTGELAVEDAVGRFDGVAELARLIAGSEVAKRCFSEKWLAHAYARPLSAADACSLSQLEPAFAGGKIRELLLALSVTDGFLYRPLPATAP